MRNTTALAHDIYAEPIYRLQRDLEDLEGLMVESASYSTGKRA